MDRQNISSNSTPRPPDRPALHLVKPAFGYLVALACLAWIFHDIHIEELLRNMPTIKWRWVALAVVCDTLGFICQGLRWRLLLRPTGSIPLLRTTQAIYAGLFISQVLPMHFGELARAYLISRWVSAEFSSVIPSIVVERLFDGVWLALAIGLVTIFVPLPGDFLKAGNILGMIVLIATGFFIYIVFRNQKSLSEQETGKSLGRKPLSLITLFLERLAIGLRSIGTSRFFYTAFGVSLFILVFQSLAFWLVMQAYGLKLPFWAGAVVFLIVHLGTAIPNAPANIGTYQFFCIMGLTLFGIEKTPATGFSVVVFALLTTPLSVIGFFALSRSGMTLYTIRSEINKLMAR